MLKFEGMYREGHEHILVLHVQEGWPKVPIVVATGELASIPLNALLNYIREIGLAVEMCMTILLYK